jgi:murein DD-endopeptidase MepM/ murein hydrolase activator NlpD
VEDLERANPGVDPKRLQIGQQLNMIVPKPFLTVVTEEIASLKESIPYETEYKESSEFYKGESIATAAGKYGEKEIKARITRENGIETGREILEEKVIKQPVTRMVAIGTKPPPPRQGTGTFAYPARGKITSGFGRRGQKNHNGIDIALPTGTPVKAADGGTVTFSGRQGTYGYLVIIDHGEGYTSYYGHNSKNLVSKGDKVHKGQTIALSGNTGRSTGPHLHFEVRKFGVPVNPINYLKE